jgi:hypothetical protein
MQPIWTAALRMIPGAIAVLISTATIAAPAELYGKSIVVTWTEARMQRLQGETSFHPAERSGEFIVYVSIEGHVFNRRVTTNNGRRGGEGSADQIGNVGKSAISFQSHLMTAVQMQEHGARSIAVSFDQSFSSCTAEVIRGKEDGANAIVADSLIHPGRITIIQSVHISGVSCTIRQGNAFAGQ